MDPLEDNKLKELNNKNDIEIHSVSSELFKTYGRVHTGFDVESAVQFMEGNTDIPEDGNIYTPSVKEMENMDLKKEIETLLYGGKSIEIGYCNGRNKTYNGFEYHKGSEINIAVTDFMLSLGHIWEINDNKYKVSDAKVFFVPKGTVLEMYETTLHLSPIRVEDSGFKCIVILPEGTNTPLSPDEKKTRDEFIKKHGENTEERLLLQRNKWVISHKDREPLMKQGAYPGLIGENKELYY